MHAQILRCCGVVAVLAILTTSVFAQDNLYKEPVTLANKEVHGNRLLVQLTGAVTEARLDTLTNYGTVHLVIDRYNAVAITPKGPAAAAELRRLGFVKVVESDFLVYPIGTGTWDRDIIDTVDVEETGFTANFNDIEDPREVAETGAGVHVAVIDTGLVKNWRDLLPESQVATEYAQVFMGGGSQGAGAISNPPNLWERDTNSHGTAVASHIIGFYRNVSDGTTVKRVYFEGSAPEARIIPLKVFPNAEAFAWNSHTMAALAYATSLKASGEVEKLVINMSLGGGRPSAIYREAIRDAIRAGVIVVAAAGNEGEAGMSWPGAYPEIISVGATGWTGQWTPLVTNSWWWTTDVTEVDAQKIAQTFIAPFSSRAILSERFGFPPQELDVLAPGMWTVAPGGHQGTTAFFFWTGTSFSSPLVAGVAALMLERDGTLEQAQVEQILKTTALPIPAIGSRAVFDPLVFGGPGTYSWDTVCGTLKACDPVGAGLVQADAALAAIP